MKNFDLRKSFLDYSIVLLGCIILAFAITSVLKPNGLMTGGLPGMAILLERLLYIPYTYAYFILNLIIFVVAWLLIGKKEMLKILFVSMVFPVILSFMANYPYDLIQDDLVLATVYYGVLGGLGIGLIFKRGFSMGGTGAIAKILHMRFLPFMSISQLIFAVDAVVILCSIPIFGKHIALYAMITQLIFTKVIDVVIFGFGSKKVKLEVISDEYHEIELFIIDVINRGVCAYDIAGGYTNDMKRKLVCICSPREAMIIRRFIANVDACAFVSVLSVVSVWGKGAGFEPLPDTQ